MAENMRNELLIAVKVWKRVDITKRSLESLVRHTKGDVDFMIFMDKSPLELVQFVSDLKLPFKYYEHPQGLGIMTRKVFEYAFEKEYKYLYHSDNDYVYSFGWIEQLLAIMMADEQIGLVSGFHHPGAKAFSRVEIAEVVCREAPSTIGGSCLFRVSALRELFEKRPMKELVKKQTWDWGVTSALNKMYRVISVEDSLVQHFGEEGVHKYVKGERFVGEENENRSI